MEDNLNSCGCCGCNRCNKGYNETLGSRYVCPVEPKSCTKNMEGAEHACRNQVFECPNTANDGLSGYAIAMAYVPWQQWGDVFTGECGLDHGTIFPDLVKPLAAACKGNK